MTPAVATSFHPCLVFALPQRARQSTPPSLEPRPPPGRYHSLPQVINLYALLSQLPFHLLQGLVDLRQISDPPWRAHGTRRPLIASLSFGPIRTVLARRPLIASLSFGPIRTVLSRRPLIASLSVAPVRTVLARRPRGTAAPSESPRTYLATNSSLPREAWVPRRAPRPWRACWPLLASGVLAGRPAGACGACSCNQMG